VIGALLVLALIATVLLVACSGSTNTDPDDHP